MKKLISIFLTLSLILSLSATAFADTTLNIEGQTEDVEYSYNGYKLLDLTISLKTGTHPDGCDGANHSDDCYNYAYTVNGKYKQLLQNEVFVNNTWGENGIPEKPEKLEGVTDDQIIKYLEAQSSDNNDGTPGSLRPVADRIYRAIKKDSSIVADKPDMTGVNDNIDNGYWLIADVTDLSDEEDKANSLVMLDTKGASNITVSPKTAIPTLEKKLKDINDSEDANIDDNIWQDAADYDIGDTVPFKLTATLPSNFASYEDYQLIFHDNLSAGLTLNSDSITVKMYASKTDADADNNGETVAFTKVPAEEVADDCTFEVKLENVEDFEDVTKESVFVVYYNATLNEKAELGAAGNPNEAYLEFSNNPYDEGTGKTNNDKVIVFTYKVTVNKTDKDGKPLPGAGFTLYKKNAAGNYVAIGTELKGDGKTTFSWEGLDDGDYKLEESTVPAGYNKIEDVEFTIVATHSDVADEPALTELKGGNLGTGAVTSGTITKDIVNLTGTVLPETGAKGTMMLITGSAMFVILAAVFMVTRKKMSIYED